MIGCFLCRTRFLDVFVGRVGLLDQTSWIKGSERSRSSAGPRKTSTYHHEFYQLLHGLWRIARPPVFPAPACFPRRVSRQLVLGSHSFASRFEILFQRLGALALGVKTLLECPQLIAEFSAIFGLQSFRGRKLAFMGERRAFPRSSCATRFLKMSVLIDALAFSFKVSKRSRALARSALAFSWNARK